MAPVSTPERLSRELAYREDHGVRVRLLWNQAEDRTFLSVADSGLGRAFEVTVEHRDALDAFYHPYAYAAFDSHHTHELRCGAQR